MKVLFPTSQVINPGFHVFETVRVETQEIWYMGHLVEEKEVEIFEDHGITVPDPGEEPDPQGDPENGWPLRGVFAFADRTFEVIRDDDQTFWGEHPNGRPRDKAAFIAACKAGSDTFITECAALGWWDLDSQGNVLRPAMKISIAAMVAQNKTLMAHLMVDLKIFPSVGQAKKNGWDKPLELGRHEVGPKKKRIIVEIVK